MSATAFVIMSFDPEYDQVYTGAIKPAVEERDYACIRADEQRFANIPAEIIRHIIDADIVVADISDPRPNVFYELAVSHCLGNKTIVVTRNMTGLPFDISRYRAIAYEDTKNGRELLKHRIVADIDELKRNTQGHPKNLVQEAGRDFFDLRKQIRESLARMNSASARLFEYVDLKARGEELQDNTAVADKVVAQVASFRGAGVSSPRRLVALAGPGAVGKSTFAHLVARRIREQHPTVTVDILPTDSYQLPRADRLEQNLIGFERRSHDLERMRTDVESLMAGTAVSVTPYDHKTGESADARDVVPSDVIILEGVYAFWPLVSIRAPGLKYYIFADEDVAKTLKFIADVTERRYPIEQAFRHADEEHCAYESHILPLFKYADHVISVVGYWKYDFPAPDC